jgi:hypothetical protein
MIKVKDPSKYKISPKSNHPEQKYCGWMENVKLIGTKCV